MVLPFSKKDAAAKRALKPKLSLRVSGNSQTKCLLK